MPRALPQKFAEGMCVPSAPDYGGRNVDSALPASNFKAEATDNTTRSHPT